MSEKHTTGSRPHGPRGGPGGGMVPGEKAKDFKGTVKKLLCLYRPVQGRGGSLCCSLPSASTVFTIVGPKILGKATTELFNGLVAKVTGRRRHRFRQHRRDPAVCCWDSTWSAPLFSFIQGWIMTGVTQKICYRHAAGDLSEKINRMPMKYFEPKPYGEVLSRITNDVDTLGQSLNQSVTQLITSIATIIGVLVMMLTISPLMTLIALVILPVSADLCLHDGASIARSTSARSRSIWATSTARWRRSTPGTTSSRPSTARRR